jgi:hypothetical protein
LEGNHELGNPLASIPCWSQRRIHRRHCWWRRVDLDAGASVGGIDATMALGKNKMQSTWGAMMAVRTPPFSVGLSPEKKARSPEKRAAPVENFSPLVL